ncbi:MAG: HAMP domain-containing histidine kinase [Acidobacteria bacterium]|nr:HAMP domain-containing histidine kinase [Acidobacteriota bacterium]
MCDVWYRSLYWRISLGIIAFLAVMLTAQGFLFFNFSETGRELPTMWYVSGGLLAIGTAIVVTVVFGSGPRRLWELREAAVRIDAGDLMARAPERGVDEVAVVAHSFNRVVDDLAARARMLEQSDRVRRQLLADISHELMTPLTAIRGYIDTLAMAEIPLDQPTRDRYFRNMDDETHRLENIIKDLRDLARLEGGGIALHPKRLSVSGLFERIAARHEQELAALRITLIRRVDAGAESFEGDPDRLEQALQNLAANALRYTSDGGEIHLTATAAGDAVRLRVRDTGPGIAPEHLPLIFDRFYKADTARRGSRGSGLGLSIVKAIVERHAGTIRADNDPTGGAVFELDMPRRFRTEIAPANAAQPKYASA